MTDRVIFEGEQILWADFALRYYGYPIYPGSGDDESYDNVPNKLRVSDDSCALLSDICWQKVTSDEYGNINAARQHVWRRFESSDGVVVLDPVQISIGNDSARYILRAIGDLLNNETLDEHSTAIRSLLKNIQSKYIKKHKSTEQQGTMRQSLYNLAQYIIAQIDKPDEAPRQKIMSE